MPRDAAREALSREAGQECELWDVHWPAYDIATSCHWPLAVGMGAVVYVGLPTLEIEAVARAKGVPLDSWLLDEIRVFESEVVRCRNAAQ